MELFARNHDVLWNAAKTGAERAEIDRTAIAVARRTAGKEGEIAVAARIDEGLGAQSMPAAMIVEANLSNPITIAHRLANQGMQEDLDTRLDTDFIERALHGFRIEHHEHATVADRRRDRAETTQLCEHFVRYSSDGLAHLLAERVQAAIGQHIADGRRTAKAACLFDQGGAGAASRRSSRRRDAGASTSDHDHIKVVLLDH
jgi:hypothetical protein